MFKLERGLPCESQATQVALCMPDRVLPHGGASPFFASAKNNAMAGSTGLGIYPSDALCCTTCLGV